MQTIDIGTPHAPAGLPGAAADAELLSLWSVALGESLDDPTALVRIAQLLVPSLADWCVVDVVEAARLSPVGWWHVDACKTPLVAQLHRDYPVDPSSSQPQASALRTGTPCLVPEVSDALLQSLARDNEHLRRLKTLEPRSILAVPLLARGRAVGILTLVHSVSGRQHGTTDLALAEQYAGPMAIAMDNSQRYRTLCQELQHRSQRDRYLRTIFHQLPGAVWAVDHELHITYANGALPNVSAEVARKLIGTTLYDFLATRDSSHPVIARHLDALTGQRQSFETQFRDRWFQTLLEPLRDEQRAIIGCVGASFDITEQRLAKEHISQGEARLAEAQAVAHVGSFEKWEIEPNTVTWSEELRRIYGITLGAEPKSYEDFLQHVHPDDMELTRNIVFDAYRQTKPFIYDHRVVRPDGDVRVLHTRGDVIKDSRGKALRLVGTCWDVTELTEATRAREQVTSLLQATLEATADGIVVVDRARRVEMYNQRFRSLWGIPPELAGHPSEDTLLTFQRALVDNVEDFDEAVQELRRNPQLEATAFLRLKDGRVLERFSRPQKVGDAIVGRVTSFRDISEHDRSLRRTQFISDASRLLTSLDVEAGLNAIAQLCIPYLGDACAVDLFGVEAPRRLVALSYNSQYSVPSEAHRTVLAGHPILYRVGPVSHLSVPLFVKSGLAGAISFALGLGRTHTSVHMEIALELARRAGMALENARLLRRAQGALATRDEFLPIAAHEIRGPLTSIHLSVQALKRGHQPAGQMPHMLALIEREDRRLAELVEKLLDLGRIQTGQLQLELEPVDLGEVVRDVVGRLSEEMACSGSSLSLSIEGRVVGQWDRFRLGQVVTNLLSNASKFGLGKPLEITIGARADRGLLAVRDHGIGIPPETRARVFNLFERGVSAHHYGGLGVGLYIVQTIVTALGGAVRLESQVGSGSTFTVELPLLLEA